MSRLLVTFGFACCLLTTFAFASSSESCARSEPLGALPGADQVLCYTGFAVGYSYDLRIPIWASYSITNSSANGLNVERRDRFRESPEIPEQYRSLLSDYRGSGYDRGHMAGSATIDFSRSANDETFFLSNIVPQRPGFNRDGFGMKGVWGYLENETRDWVSERKRLYVVSGAIASGENRIGSGVAVPEWFYKIFIDLNTGESLAFLMPHEENTREQAASYLTSIDAIEKLSGLDFFARIVDAQEKKLESRVAPSLWP